MCHHAMYVTLPPKHGECSKLIPQVMAFQWMIKQTIKEQISAPRWGNVTMDYKHRSRKQFKGKKCGNHL